jgi:hypothetical protein
MNKQFELGVTNDYSIFKPAKNRSVDARKVAKKKESIAQINLQQPIIVNKRMQVVDGQHRFQALKELGMPINYIVSHNWRTDEDTATMNNTQDSWNTINWVEFRISQGNQIAREAMELARNYEMLTEGKMTINTALEMMFTKRGISLKTAFKDDCYDFDNEMGNEVFQIVSIISEYPSDMKNPYNQKLVRSIKLLKNDLGYINKKAIARMAKKNLISVYNNENQMAKYIKKIYNQALKTS